MFLAKGPSHNEIAKRLDPETSHEYQEPPKYEYKHDKYDSFQRFCELMRDPVNTPHPDEDTKNLVTLERAQALFYEVLSCHLHPQRLTTHA